mmetsp:Transcript_22003/g.63442  ORF Transcript_22003/g.63442 Transcript_22003/m.63442 type:complete len:264 (-) Transcript_22003:92-883(-)
MTMNSSPGWRLKVRTSGVQQTCCSCGGRRWSFLYRKSPMARDRLRSPFTLYKLPWGQGCSMTVPPALRILANSEGLLGLWSSDMSTALPPRQRTARQSPALATTTASGLTRQTMAVQPMKSGCTRGALEAGASAFSSVRVLGSQSSSSICWKAARRAPTTFPLGCRASSSGSRCSQKRATCSPPWPSMTPKTAVSFQPLRCGIARWASSMRSRQPCMQLTPQTRPRDEDRPWLDFFSVTGPWKPPRQAARPSASSGAPRHGCC